MQLLHACHDLSHLLCIFFELGGRFINLGGEDGERLGMMVEGVGRNGPDCNRWDMTWGQGPSLWTQWPQNCYANAMSKLHRVSTAQLHDVEGIAVNSVI